MMSLPEQAKLCLVAALRARSPRTRSGCQTVLGRRPLGRIFDTGRTSRPLPRAVEDLITDLMGHHGDPKAQAELEVLERTIDAGGAYALIDLIRVLRGDMGGAEGAQAVFQQAVGYGDPGVASGALVDLGYLRMLFWRDYAGAQPCFEQAVRFGHARWAPDAMVGLAKLLEEQGKMAGAQAAYQRAAEAGNADCAGHALVFPSGMLCKRGDRHGARSAFQRAVDLGNADWPPAARDELLNLLSDGLPRDRSLIF